MYVNLKNYFLLQSFSKLIQYDAQAGLRSLVGSINMGLGFRGAVCSLGGRLVVDTCTQIPSAQC